MASPERPAFRCRIFGHDYRDSKGWEPPDLIAGKPSIDIEYRCSRCNKSRMLSEDFPSVLKNEVRGYDVLGLSEKKFIPPRLKVKGFIEKPRPP